MNKCPCCLQNDLQIFDQARINGQAVNILICKSCLVLLNEYAYERLAASHGNILEVQTTEFYSISELNNEFIDSEVELNALNLSFIFSELNYEPRGKVFLDFGAGRGTTALAASRYFGTVLATDFNQAVLLATLATHRCGRQIRVLKSLNEFRDQIDFVFAWHVLEHMDEPRHWLQSIRKSISLGGVLALQVPKYRAEYIIDSHYAFYSSISLEKLLFSVGFSEIKILHDFDNHYLTCLATLR